MDNILYALKTTVTCLIEPHLIKQPKLSVSKKELTAVLHSHFQRVPGEVTKALSIASKIHKKQKRNNGEMYLEGHIYPIAEYYLSSRPEPTITGTVLAIVHDALEDSNYPDQKNTIKLLSIDVQSEVQKLSKIRLNNKEKQYKIYVNQLLTADEETLVIKTIDIMQNLVTDIDKLKARPLPTEDYNKIAKFVLKVDKNYRLIFDSIKDYDPKLNKQAYKLLQLANKRVANLSYTYKQKQ